MYIKLSDLMPRFCCHIVTVVLDFCCVSTINGRIVGFLNICYVSAAQRQLNSKQYSISLHFHYSTILTSVPPEFKLNKDNWNQTTKS